MLQDHPDQDDMTPEVYKAESENDTKSKKFQKKPKAQRWDDYHKAVWGSMTDDEWQTRGMIPWPTTPSSSSSTDSQPEVTRIRKAEKDKKGKNRAKKDKNKGKGKGKNLIIKSDKDKGKNKSKGKDKGKNKSKGKDKAKEYKTWTESRAPPDSHVSKTCVDIYTYIYLQLVIWLTNYLIVWIITCK